MGDFTVIRPAAAKFGIHEIIYIRESALSGFLEPIKVYNFSYNRDLGIYFYSFVFKKSSPSTQTVGDAMDLKSERVISLPEDALCSYYEALVIQKNILEKELAKNASLLARYSDSTV